MAFTAEQSDPFSGTFSLKLYQVLPFTVWIDSELCLWRCGSGRRGVLRDCPAILVGCVPPCSQWHTQGVVVGCVLPRLCWNTGSETLLGSHFVYASSLRQPDKIFILSGDSWYSQCKLQTHLPAATEGENNRIRDWVFTLASSAKCKWLP